MAYDETVETGSIRLVNHPKGITQANVTTITIRIAALAPGEQLTLDIETRVNNTAVRPETIRNIASLSSIEASLESGESSVNVPPPPRPDDSDDDDDDDDDEDDREPTAPPSSSLPQVQPTPTLPVKHLPETGLREPPAEAVGYGWLWLVLLGSGLLGLYLRRKLRRME